MELRKRETQSPNVPSRIKSILSKYDVVDESLMKESVAEVDLESIYVDVEVSVGVGNRIADVIKVASLIFLLLSLFLFYHIVCRYHRRRNASNEL